MRSALYALSLLFLAACKGDEPVVDGDPDGDGAEGPDDCAPYDALSAPGLPELCDGRDNNCDGAVDEGVGAAWYTDADGDGFGDETTAQTSCTSVAGSVSTPGDCDDADPRFHPGAGEDCSTELDFNCDGSVSFDDADNDGSPACRDCDDTDATAFPGAAETCDETDNDCDGQVDNNATDAIPVYLDLDGDGHGSDRFTEMACEASEGFAVTDDDCDDLLAGSYPGAPEDCDGVDNDCNGEIDEDVGGTSFWYPDADGDGFGDSSLEVSACARPFGYVDNPFDCDDTNAKFNPTAAESCEDPQDYNCDGNVGVEDQDEDGTPACEDCDDNNPEIYPLAQEACDGLDNDCDGETDETAPVWYADIDGDGHGSTRFAVSQCDTPAGYVASSDDCDDLLATRYPGNSESCDGLDNDCVGGVPNNEKDADNDGVRVCASDCDDTKATVHPGAVEVCNTVDDDCSNGVDVGAVDARPLYLDADGDGYGTGSASYVCGSAVGYSALAGDCNDASTAVKPGAAEVCNGVDNDCDGDIDENPTNGTVFYLDADGDGVGGSKVSVASCAAPTGYVATSTDCNDLDATTRPGASELCDGRDNDCTAGIPANEADADGDGFRSCANDCNDTKAAINPSAVELCNGVDDNCNTSTDETGAVDAPSWYADNDSDGYGNGAATKACSSPGAKFSLILGDCNDTNAAISPGDSELCATVGVDDDCDGSKDESGAADSTAWFVDNDGDSHGIAGSFVLQCAQPAGRAATADDCNDQNNKIYGGATETYYDGIDSNCDGKSDFDQDNDGRDAHDYEGTDCFDTDASQYKCGLTATTPAYTCLDVHTSDATAGDGLYYIDPNGGSPSDSWRAYCDMTRNGGGWTLVMQNMGAVGAGNSLNWNDAVYKVNVPAGSFGANLATFDYWVGLSYWKNIGTTGRIEVGATPGTPLHQATFTRLAVNAGDNYSLDMSGITVTVGATTPSMYDYHAANHDPLSTSDRENDAYAAGSCYVQYTAAWWYHDCWSGSFWGSANAGHTKNAYWTGSQSDYYAWGAIWLR